MTYRKILTITVVVSVLVSMSAVPVVAQSGGGAGGPGDSEFEILEFEENVVETGESEAVITFNSNVFLSEGDGSGYIMTLEPKNVDITNIETPSSGYWNEDKKKILFTDPPDSVDVVVNVEGNVEDNTSMGVRVTDGNVTNDERFSLSLKQELRNVIDENNNYVLDDGEILEAVSYWVNGDVVPGYGEEISDEEILDLIELWENNTNFKEVGAL